MRGGLRIRIGDLGHARVGREAHRDRHLVLEMHALLTLAASAFGTNLPSRTTPLAWADRCVVCLPNAALSASTNDSGVVAIAGSFRVFIAVLRGAIPSPELRAEGPGVQARPRCVSKPCIPEL